MSKEATLVSIILNRQDEYLNIENHGVPHIYVGDKPTDDLEQELRDCVQEFLKGEHGDDAIVRSSRDFNWGDYFIEPHAEDLLQQRGFYRVGSFTEPVVLKGYEIISLNHDEVLLDSDIDAVLHIKPIGGGTELVVPATVSMYSGCVDVDVDGFILGDKARCQFYITFGNGVMHPVGISEARPYYLVWD